MEYITEYGTFREIWSVRIETAAVSGKGVRTLIRSYREQTPEEMALLEELAAYQRSGCSICLNGRPCYPQDVVAACFRENTQYMRDIVSDDGQTIRKIDFIRIRTRDNAPVEDLCPKNRSYYGKTRRG